MKKIVVFAALAGLAACSKPAETPAAEASAAPQAAASVAGPVAADGKSSVGTFKVTEADGKAHTEVVKPDGTYETTWPDGKVETGTWEQKGPNLYCGTKPGEKQRCNEEKVENGVWTSKDPDGKIATVERIGRVRLGLAHPVAGASGHPRLEHDLRATVLLVVELAVAFRAILQRHGVADQEGRI